jgi:hypothetical protein
MDAWMQDLKWSCRGERGEKRILQAGPTLPKLNSERFPIEGGEQHEAAPSI